MANCPSGCIDTHAHLAASNYDTTIDETIAHAKALGVLLRSLLIERERGRVIP